MQTKLLMALQLSEDLFHKNQGSKAALQVIYRYWMTAAFVPDKRAAFLQKAHHTAVFHYKKDVASIELLLSVLFMNLELMNLTAARELLNNVNNAKPYLRANNPKAYASLLYLAARLEFAEDKKRGVTKIFRQLEVYFNEAENPALRSVVAVYIASLAKNVYDNNEVALTYFIEAQKTNTRSLFLFVELYRFLGSYPVVTGIEKPLVYYLQWAVCHGAPITDFMYQYTPGLMQTVADWEQDISFIQSLYEVCRLPWLLACNAKARIEQDDISTAALAVYRETVDQGLSFAGLPYYYALSGFRNDYDDLPVELAASEIESKKHSGDVLCYLYHILILNDQQTAQKYEADILDNGSAWFTKRRAGKYYATVYIYILEKFQYDTNLCKIVFEHLFSYELRIDDRKLAQKIKTIWVSEKEKKEMAAYPFENGAAYIRAATDQFTVFFLSAKQTAILVPPGYRVKRLSPNMDAELLKRLYAKGFVSADLLISFCHYFIDSGEFSDQAKQIMTQTLTVSGISDSFRSRVSLHLGHLFLRQNLIDKAYSYYNAASEKFMTADDAEKLLRVYMQSGETKEALALLERKKDQLPDKIVFYTLKQIIQKDELKKSCANLAYALLLKACYDREFVDIVLGYYNGSLANWIALLDKLKMMGIEIEACYEAALKKGTMMGKYNDGLQKIFTALYNKNPQSKWVERFAYYTASQVLPRRQSIVLLPETVGTLEKMLPATEDNKLLCYLLAHTYIVQNLTSPNADKIIRLAAGYMEEDGTYLPAFRNFQDKNFLSSYMEMNLPFSYGAHPRKDIYLCYRFDEAAPYTKIRMRYFKFGLYLAVVPLFYQDKIQYCFEEDMITSEPQTYEHVRIRFVEQYANDYYHVNNALIYSTMFKYDKVEEIIDKKVQAQKNYVLHVL